MGGADRGQAVPAFMMVLAVAMLMIVVVAQLGRAADDVARARTAADAAALAGAAEGRIAAAAMAAANDGDLLDYSARGDTVEVMVEVGGARARARAAITVDWVP